MDRLFVYGSLQPGGPNEHVLSKIEGEWEAATVKGFLKEEGWGAGIGYPGLVLDEHGIEVRGSVLAAPDLSAVWDTLDQFEGEEYRRVLSTVNLSSGEQVNAYVYILRCS